MADCGATGTALDRAVAAATSSSSASKQALASFVGHASMNGNGRMPAAPPTFLSTSSVTVMHHPSPELHQRPMAFPHHDAPTPTQQPFSFHPPHYYWQQQHPHAVLQQQQQHMMMQQQIQMMQQQQQQMMLMQQQQQQEATTRRYLKSDDYVQDEFSDETEHASNKHHTLEDWHEGLGEEEEVIEGHEGLTQGASIEELAAAWAQAEAEYEDSVNLGAVYQHQQEEATTLYPYDFETTQLDNIARDKDWMKEAQELFDRGEIANAIQCCETELKVHDQHNAKAWYLLGKCHAEQDEDTKAIACLERSVEMDPYSPPALLALGVSHVNELNHGRALLNLQNWMTHNPKYAGLDLPGHDVYSASTEKETAFEQAQRLLLRALEHDPSDAQVHEALGVVYNISRDYDAAIASFQKALELSSSQHQSYSLWNKIGATLANANRSEEALPHYHSALQLRPKYARAWLNMAISHSNLKNYDEAARCYLQTLSLNPSARHCWSYLRIALSCSEKWDLIPLAAKQDLSAFSEYYDFVQY